MCILAGTLGAFEPSDEIDHRQDETAALEVAHVTLGPKYITRDTFSKMPILISTRLWNVKNGGS